MGVYLGALILGVPCLIFLIYTYTPKGKEWMRMNVLLLERKLTMGVYLVALTVGVPCALFLLYCLTPKGKHWLRMNGML